MFPVGLGSGRGRWRSAAHSRDCEAVGGSGIGVSVRCEPDEWLGTAIDADEDFCAEGAGLAGIGIGVSDLRREDFAEDSDCFDDCLRDDAA